MKREITSMADLEAKQAELKSSLQLIRYEFGQSLQQNKKLLRVDFLKKILLPSGIITLGIAAAKERKELTPSTKIKSSDSEASLSSVVAIITKLLPQLFLYFRKA